MFNHEHVVDALAQGMLSAIYKEDATVFALAVAELGSLREPQASEAAAQAFFRACQNRQPAMVQILLDAGFPPNHPRAADSGYTPAITACYHGDHESLRIVLAAGGDPLILGEAGTSAMACAAHHGHAECVRLLAATGCPLLHGSIDGRSPLEAAIAKGHCEVVEAMMDSGLSPNEKLSLAIGDPSLGSERRLSWPSTPLSLSARHDQPAVARLLIARGALVDGFDGRGFTPLMWACLWISLDVGPLLIEAGADPRLPHPGDVLLPPFALPYCLRITQASPFQKGRELASLVSERARSLDERDAIGFESKPAAAIKAAPRL